MLDLVEFVLWATALKIDPADSVTTLADGLKPMPLLGRPRKAVPAKTPAQPTKPRKTVRRPN